MAEPKIFAGFAPRNAGFSEKKVEALVLSGGGVRGAGHLGVLLYHIQKGDLVLSRLSHYAGTSIGSMICALLAVGYEPLEILEASSEFEKVLGGVSGFDFVGVSDGYGVVSSRFIVKILDRLFKKKLGTTPTFADLQAKGKTLYVTVANITRKRVEYLSYLTDPDLKISEAVAMSCNLPLIFKRISYRGSCFSDGGLGDNFPTVCIDSERYPTLASIVSGDEIDGGPGSNPEESFLQYIRALLMTPIVANTNAAVSKLHPSVKLVEVKMDGIDSFSFSVDRETKMKMCLIGYQEAHRVDRLEKIYVDLGDPSGAETEVSDESGPDESVFESWDRGWEDEKFPDVRA